MRKGLKPRPPRRVGNSVTGQQVGREDLPFGGCQAAQARMRDLETLDSELRLVAAIRRAVREPINYAWSFGSRLRHALSLLTALEWADPQDDPQRLSGLHRHR